jgi:NAD(P)-dependent dehydrogenase (short-subunit alcohol dehydrogenase family)
VIVNMGSVCGLEGCTGHPHYSAAKAGILGFTKSVGMELIQQGVRVNAIAPGDVGTETLQGPLAERRRAIAQATPARASGGDGRDGHSSRPTSRATSSGPRSVPTAGTSPSENATEENLMLDGKVALVTGAGQGIGRAIAVEIAHQGAAGVAVTDRNRDTAEQTAQAVHDAGAASTAITCDLRDRDQIEAMVADAVSALSGLDVLVNNAGIIETTLTDTATVDAIPEDVWDAVYEVNLKAPWLATKFAAPHLRQSQRGPSIVNAASVSGLTGFPDGPAYCNTKGGVVQLTRVTAVDLAPAGAMQLLLSRRHRDAAVTHLHRARRRPGRLPASDDLAPAHRPHWATRGGGEARVLLGVGRRGLHHGRRIRDRRRCHIVDGYQGK